MISSISSVALAIFNSRPPPLRDASASLGSQDPVHFPFPIPPCSVSVGVLVPLAPQRFVEGPGLVLTRPGLVHPLRFMTWDTISVPMTSRYVPSVRPISWTPTVCTWVSETFETQQVRTPEDFLPNPCYMQLPYLSLWKLLSFLLLWPKLLGVHL